VFRTIKLSIVAAATVAGFLSLTPKAWAQG
jgi:hypothetical protein